MGRWWRTDTHDTQQSLVKDPVHIHNHRMNTVRAVNQW